MCPRQCSPRAQQRLTRRRSPAAAVTATPRSLTGRLAAGLSAVLRVGRLGPQSPPARAAQPSPPPPPPPQQQQTQPQTQQPQTQLPQTQLPQTQPPQEELEEAVASPLVRRAARARALPAPALTSRVAQLKRPMAVNAALPPEPAASPAAPGAAGGAAPAPSRKRSAVAAMLAKRGIHAEEVLRRPMRLVKPGPRGAAS